MFESVGVWYNVIMNTISRTITGIVTIICGLYIIYASLSNLPEEWCWVFVWGMFFVVVGTFIFLNKKEDDIEEIKSRKN